LAEIGARAVALVLHDVAPSTWPLFEDFVAAVDGLGDIPLTLLVVPDFHRQGRLDSQPAFVKIMHERLARGDELVLHGYYHDDPGPVPLRLPEYFMRRMYTHEGEFFRLDGDIACERLEQGLALFHRLDWPVQGFVPPAWLLGQQTRAALQSLPFSYTSSLAGLIRLPEFTAVPAPSLVWSSRSSWRRCLSLLWNRQRLACQSEAGLLRIGVHPVDMQYPGVQEYMLKILHTLLMTRIPLTKQQWLAQRV
jgi:predicted deacetylase